MSRSSLRTRKGCAGVSCELWWTKIKRSQRKSHSGMLQQIAWWKTVFFPLSLTTSSGQNAQIQAETTCWSQQGCLSLDFDACVTNGKQNPTGKDPHKCLRASPYTPLVKYVSANVFLKILLGALLQSFLPLSQGCDFAV